MKATFPRSIGIALVGLFVFTGTAGAGRHGRSHRHRQTHARSALRCSAHTLQMQQRTPSAHAGFAYRSAAPPPVGLAQPAAKGCRLRFAGAAGTVTGSLHMVESGGKRLLVDCGMVQGTEHGKSRWPRQVGTAGRTSPARPGALESGGEALPPEAIAADGALITHAHIDHSGDMPLLVKSGYRGKFHCTPATADLLRCMLPDSARLQQAKARTKTRTAKPGHPPLPPRYSQADVREVLRRLETHPVGEVFCPVPGMKVTFSEAGHIAGAVSPVVTVGQGARQRRIAFSGDLGRRNSLIVNDPVPPSGADYVVMESTYGNRMHGESSDMLAQLRDVVRSTQKRGGKVLIPAFSVHRTPEVLFLLRKLQAEGTLRMPVYVDSPLSSKALAVYRAHPETQRPAMRQGGGAGPYTFSDLRVISARQTSKKLDTLKGPAVIISSAGMANAGRIQRHLTNHAADPRNTIAIVGYMTPGSPGRRIRNGDKVVPLNGHNVKIGAQVTRLSAFSGHADKADLQWWAKSCGSDVKRFFVVHGELEQSRALADALRAEGKQATVPAAGDTFDIN